MRSYRLTSIGEGSYKLGEHKQVDSIGVILKVIYGLIFCGVKVFRVAMYVRCTPRDPKSHHAQKDLPLVCSR